MFKRVQAGCLLAVAMALHSTSFAAELKDLYQAKVMQSSTMQEWQRAAMSSVLVRITGSEAVLSVPAVAAQLAQSGNYVVQYQNIREQGKAMLQVTLDAQKLNQLLQSQQIPLWGPRRPDVLLWLSERINQQPAFVINPEHPFRKALLQQAERFGLSLQFPLHDVDDTSLVNDAAAWAGDWQALASASQRYKADQVQNLLLDQVPDASGTLLYRLTYQVQQGSDIVSKELQHADAMVLASQFCAELAGQQASQYAVNLNMSVSDAGHLELVIADVQSLSDVIALQKIMGSMLTVKNVQLTEFQPGTAKLSIELSSSTADFYRAVSLVKQLQPLEPLQVEPLQATPTTSDSGTMNTALEPTTGAVAVEAPVDATLDVVPDAQQQQALQDELQSELASNPPETAAQPQAADAQSASQSVAPATALPTAPVPATGTQIIETNHYRFSRS